LIIAKALGWRSWFWWKIWSKATIAEFDEIWCFYLMWCRIEFDETWCIHLMTPDLWCISLIYSCDDGRIPEFENFWCNLIVAQHLTKPNFCCLDLLTWCGSKYWVWEFLTKSDHLMKSDRSAGLLNLMKYEFWCFFYIHRVRCKIEP
jgi:hypothetical protein